MIMNIFVTTRSGSRYHFKMENGTLVFSRGLNEGIVLKMHNALKIGNKLHMDCKMRNMYMEEDSDITTIASTEIVEMTVSVNE